MVPALRLWIVCATLKQIKMEINTKVVVVSVGRCRYGNAFLIVRCSLVKHACVIVSNRLCFSCSVSLVYVSGGARKPRMWSPPYMGRLIEGVRCLGVWWRPRASSILSSDGKGLIPAFPQTRRFLTNRSPFLKHNAWRHSLLQCLIRRCSFW